jgi:hypothetical protein
MRLAMLAFVLSVSSAARAAPVIVDRESMSQQLQSLANQLSAWRNQLAGAPDADPETVRRLGQMVGQLNLLQRQLATAPPLDGAGAGGDYRPPPPPGPMDDGTFSTLVARINGEGFSDGKLRVLQEAARNNFFVCAQAKQLLPLYAFDKDRLRALELIAPRLLDRQNGFTLIESFPFSESKSKAQRILSR